MRTTLYWYKMKMQSICLLRSEDSSNRERWSALLARNLLTSPMLIILISSIKTGKVRSVLLKMFAPGDVSSSLRISMTLSPIFSSPTHDVKSFLPFRPCRSLAPATIPRHHGCLSWANSTHTTLARRARGLAPLVCSRVATRSRNRRASARLQLDDIWRAANLLVLIAYSPRDSAAYSLDTYDSFFSSYAQSQRRQHQ